MKLFKYLVLLLIAITAISVGAVHYKYYLESGKQDNIETQEQSSEVEEREKVYGHEGKDRKYSATGKQGDAVEKVKDIKGLVRVLDINDSIVIDLRYATENNFTGKKIYPVAVCMLRKETAEK